MHPPVPTLFSLVSILEAMTGKQRCYITLETTIREDLGMDALAQVELILTVEDAFAIELPEADFHTVGQLCDLITHCHTTAGFSSRFQTACASNGL